MKRVLLILLIALSLASCRGKPVPLSEDASPDNVPNIIGEYAVNGFDPTGQEYGGTLVITQGSQPNEYILQWLVTGGMQEGTGILEGNKLNVTWKSVEGSNDIASGKASYTVTTLGQLYGTRTVDGGEGEGTEEVFPNPKK
jgi:hypothetical protein